MSLNKEHSRDKTEWVKWPHLETHWRPQHYESPLRASKKGDLSRSHSWWWAGHNSPTSSKWLQENLADMDSKVNAMLKIIEEDADSFAKRAEMYYKKRPELINLIEEFYRTYRALVERHTFLTKELGQNIAPALQGQLSGVDGETPSTLRDDPLVKHKSERLDIASLSSYSFPGASEFEDDSQSEFSAKILKGFVHEEDVSPQSSRVSFDTSDVEFGRLSAMSSEEAYLLLQHQKSALDGLVDTEELRKAARILVHEKKALTAKVGEDEVKLQDLQYEVSCLLNKTKASEAEEKLAKSRLNEALQLKQTLEAENLKLSHALITCKEERTELNEALSQNSQEMFTSGERIQELERLMLVLQQKTAVSHAEVRRYEEESKRLHKQLINLEEENGVLQKHSITRRVKLEELTRQLSAADASELQLKQDLLETRELKEALQLDNSTKVFRIQELERELEATRETKQAVEGMLIKANLEVKEIRNSLNAMSSEKILLLQKASGEVDASQREMDQNSEEPIQQTIHFRDVEVALARLLRENNVLRKREAKSLISYSELEKLSQMQATKYQETLDEHVALIAQRDVSFTALIKQKDLLEEKGREAFHSSSRLEEEISLLKLERVEASKIAQRLCAEVGELKLSKDHALVKCQQFGEEYKALKAAEEGLKALLSARVAECSCLQVDKSAIESELTKLYLKMEELQNNMSALSSQKVAMRLELEAAQEQMQISNANGLQWQAKSKDSEAELQVLRSELQNSQEELAQLQATILDDQKNLDVQLVSVNNLKAERLHMQQETNRPEEQLSQAVSNHTDAERATLVAKEELSKLIKSRDMLKSEMAVVLLSVRKLELDLAGVQGEKQALSGHLESMKLEVTRVQGENANLLAQVKAIMSQLQGKDSELTTLHEQLQAAESQNCSVAAALSSMKTSWDSDQERLQSELVQLKETTAKAQKDLAIQLDTVRKLENQLSGLRGEQSLSQEELAQLKATNLGVQKDLAIQLDSVSMPKEEVNGFHAEGFLLQEDGVLHAKQLAEQLDQVEDVRKREHIIETELHELSAFAETLKQSLFARDSENLKLREDLSRAAECQSVSEKKLLDEIGFLHSEEKKWRNEATTNSALMADKVACLRMENASLHEDLSLKLELLLTLEKDVESLKEERSSLSRARQAMAAEMQDYRNDLQMYKEFVIPSLEERVGEVEEEVTNLATSNERHVAEIVSLREQLQDATDDLIRLYDENAMLKIELTFNVEMLKHVDGVLLVSKAENLQLVNALGLQTKHSQMQKQHLVIASSKNKGLSRRLRAVMEERNSLKAEVQSLLAVLVEVEWLQKELAALRQGNSSVRAVEHSSMHDVSAVISNNARGSLLGDDTFQAHMQNAQNIPRNGEESVKAEMQSTELDHGKSTFSPLAGLTDVGKIDLGGSAKESNDGRSKASALLLMGMLKEEVFYLQEQIHRLQSATAGQGLEFVSGNFGARDLVLGPQEDLSSPQKSSTASSSILTVEEAQVSSEDVLRLKDEMCGLVQEINSSHSQTLAACGENNFTENSVKDLQAKVALLEEQNERLCLEVRSCTKQMERLEVECHSLQKKNEHRGQEMSACKAEIERLSGDCQSLQEKNADFQEDQKVSTQEKRKLEEAMHMLEGVVTSLGRNNRSLHAENESASMATKHLTGRLSCLHEEGVELILLIEKKMMAALEEVKLVIEECGKKAGDEGIVQIMKDFVDLYSLPNEHLDASAPEDVSEIEQGKAMKTADQGTPQEPIRELEVQDMHILNELRARASETNILSESVVFLRKMLIRPLGNEHTCQPNARLNTTAGNLEGEKIEEHHIKLAEHLHQAFMNERLEQELLELREGRKQLKEKLEVQLAEVQQMESALEKVQVLLKKDEHGKGGRLQSGEEQRRRKNMWAEESAKELREMLAQQRRQLGRMQEEVMSGDEQREAAAENQAALLVCMPESTPSMEGCDVEQVNLRSRELESLKGLNRRHSAELRTISQDLQSMGSIIKEAQQQLLPAGLAQDVEEEIVSIANLRTQNSSVIDSRAAESQVSMDSTQQLLSPSPGLVGADSVAGRQTQSDGSTGQFFLKPRNFGFEWFLLLFSPDGKAAGRAGLAGSKSSKPWAVLRSIRRGSSGSSALMVEKERRKTASCWACVASTNRLDSFDGQ